MNTLNFKCFDLSDEQIAMIDQATGFTVYFDITNVKIETVDDSFTHEYGTWLGYHKEVDCELIISCFDDFDVDGGTTLSEAIEQAKTAAYDYLNELETDVIERIFE